LNFSRAWVLRTRLGLLIDLAERQVYVYRQGRERETPDAPETVSGDPELPGLVLQIPRIFDPSR
jgi:hypothetical protein